MAGVHICAMTLPAPGTFKATLKELYYGASPASRRFRYALVAFDLMTIGLFFFSTIKHGYSWQSNLDTALGLLILGEFLARLWVTVNKRRLLLSWVTAADIVVIASLLLPVIAANWGFLRILRAMRFLRSYHLIRDLRHDSPWFKANQEVAERSITFLVFVFTVTSFVFVTQIGINPDINNYVDALYFTVTTLTTTGFGDITLKGPWGRLESIIIMIVGVSMFLQLLHSIFKPQKVRYSCPECALVLHDSDAVHCKHCGCKLKIRSEGA